MSGYHENHLVSGTSAVHSLTNPLPHQHQPQHQHQHQQHTKPAASVPPYLSPPNPAAAHTPHALSHNGRTQGPSSAYAASAHDSLTSALQVPITPHGIVNTSAQHPHHQQIHPSPPQSQHIRAPAGQYSPPGGHASSASPQSQQAPTPAASTSSAPSKKNTRIPRACDLCSTRKVKVGCFPLLSCLLWRSGLSVRAILTYTV